MPIPGAKNAEQADAERRRAGLVAQRPTTWPPSTPSRWRARARSSSASGSTADRRGRRDRSTSRWRGWRCCGASTWVGTARCPWPSCASWWVASATRGCARSSPAATSCSAARTAPKPRWPTSWPAPSPRGSASTCRSCCAACPSWKPPPPTTRSPRPSPSSSTCTSWPPRCPPSRWPRWTWPTWRRRPRWCATASSWCTTPTARPARPSDRRWHEHFGADALGTARNWNTVTKLVDLLRST